MIKPILFTIAITVTGTQSKAQYYYKDILSNKELQAETGRLKEQKIHTINITSLESDGRESEGFFCQKKFNKSYTESELKTSTSTSYNNYFTSRFTKDGLLKQSIDSSEVSSTTAYYTYNDKQELIKIESSTNFAAEDEDDNNSEQHIYEYENGLPTKLWVIVNTKDTSLYLFKADEKNNIAIEKNAKTGDVYYYYYDSKNQLTDVVHTYATKKTLIPDYKFEYNSAGLITQMIASEKEGAYFFTWRYSYENGLRTMERCYNKEGRLTGSIEYQYK